MRVLLGAVMALGLGACASMGRPEGGPVDETPPVFVRSTPEPSALNVDRNRVVIEFDENVQIKDPMNSVTISPAQKYQARVSAVAHKVTVDLQDTLLPNTTYTIDFGDGISDLNEDNPIDGFAVAFSTGPDIDTLSISGMVFQAENLEPAQGMIVGVYSNLSDTAITTLPMERMTMTNKLGQFTLRNLKAGSYRLYALNDKNRDKHWDRTEDIAFYDVPITPSAEMVTVTDTLKNAAGEDSIVTRQTTRFSPNDIILTWFNTNYKSSYMSKYERKRRNVLNFEFGAPHDTFPRFNIVNGPRPGADIREWAVVDGSAHADTLSFWITDSAIMALDTITVAATYLKTDTLGQLTWSTDTVDLRFRESKAKKDKEKAKKKEEADTVAPAPVFINLSFTSGATQDLDRPVALKTETPIASLDSSGVHLQMRVDTLWVDVEPPRFYHPDSLRPMVMQADIRWEPGAKYQVVIDSLAMTDIYGRHNKPAKFSLTTRELNDYSTVNFNITGPTGPAVAQLLNNSDKPVKTVAVENGRATFRYVQPGVYYARLWLDSNPNGKYDIGIIDSVQPEEVYYFPKKLTVKKNWDIDQNWNIYETPLDLQKPLEIKKNKPKDKKKKGEREDDNYDEEDEYYDPNDPFGERRNAGNRRRGNRGSSMPSFMGGGMGGLQQMGRPQQ